MNRGAAIGCRRRTESEAPFYACRLSTAERLQSRQLPSLDGRRLSTASQSWADAQTAIPPRLFGEAARAERLKLSWSQDELAHRSGLNRIYMGEIERGEKAVSIETIAKIAAALKIKGGDLLLRAGVNRKADSLHKGARHPLQIRRST